MSYVEGLARIRNSLKRGVISPVYLIYGEQDFFKDQLLKEFQHTILEGENDDFNYQYFTDPVDMAEVVASAEQLPVFAERRLVVARGKNLFSESAAGDDELQSYLDNPNLSTCLVIIADKIDNRRKVIKAIKEKGDLINLTPPKGNELIAWIQEQAKLRSKSLEPMAIEMLIAASGDNLLLIAQELDKVTLFSEQTKITCQDLEQTISKTTNLNVFKITDLAIERKGAAAVQQYREMVHAGEYPLKIMALLSRSFRQLLRVKLMLTSKGLQAEEISRQLKVPSFVAKKLITQQRAFSEEKLISILSAIRDADWRIKTGSLEATVAVEIVIYKIAN